MGTSSRRSTRAASRSLVVGSWSGSTSIVWGISVGLLTSSSCQPSSGARAQRRSGTSATLTTPIGPAQERRAGSVPSAGGGELDDCCDQADCRHGGDAPRQNAATAGAASGSPRRMAFCASGTGDALPCPRPRPGRSVALLSPRTTVAPRRRFGCRPRPSRRPRGPGWSAGMRAGCARWRGSIGHPAPPAGRPPAGWVVAHARQRGYSGNDAGARRSRFSSLW